MDINLGNIDNHSAIYRVGIGEIVTVVWLEFDEEGNFHIKNESDMEDRISSLDNEVKPKIRAFIASTNDLIYTAYLIKNNK